MINNQPHYLWSEMSLDVICADFGNVFCSDKAELKKVVTIRLVNVGDVFCYKGNLYRLLRDETLKIVHEEI